MYNAHLRSYIQDLVEIGTLNFSAWPMGIHHGCSHRFSWSSFNLTSFNQFNLKRDHFVRSDWFQPDHILISTGPPHVYGLVHKFMP